MNENGNLNVLTRLYGVFILILTKIECLNKFHCHFISPLFSSNNSI